MIFVLLHVGMFAWPQVVDDLLRWAAGAWPPYERNMAALEFLRERKGIAEVLLAHGIYLLFFFFLSY